MDKLKFKSEKIKSQKLIVKGIKKKSKSRYALKINIGDVIQLISVKESTILLTTNYAIDFELYVNGESVLDYEGNMSQGEVYNLEKIFILEETGDY